MPNFYIDENGSLRYEGDGFGEGGSGNAVMANGYLVPHSNNANLLDTYATFGYPDRESFLRSMVGANYGTETVNVDGTPVLAYKAAPGRQINMPDYQPDDNWLDKLAFAVIAGGATAGFGSGIAAAAGGAAGAGGSAAGGYAGAAGSAAGMVPAVGSATGAAVGGAAGAMSPELAAWFSSAGYTPSEIAAIQSSIASGAGAGAGAVVPESYWSQTADASTNASGMPPANAGTVSTTAADYSAGLDPITTGETVNPWTTNPTPGALGGGNAGLLPDWLQAIVDKMPPGSGTVAEKAYKYVTENPEKAASLGLSAANAMGGNDTSAIDSSLALSQQDEASRSALRGQISGIFDPTKYTASDASVGDATRQYQTAELKKKYDEQERQLRFGAARSGNTLGSVATTGQQNLQESNRMGGVAIDDAVRRAIASLQSGRETAKQNALGLVNSGAGPEAVQSASQQIQALTDQAAQGDKTDLFSGLFANSATFSPTSSSQNPLAAYAAAIRNKGGITAAQPANKPNVFATG